MFLLNQLKRNLKVYISIEINTAKSKFQVLQIFKSHIYNQYEEIIADKKEPIRHGTVSESKFKIKKDDFVRPSEYIQGEIRNYKNGSSILITNTDHKFFFKIILSLSPLLASLAFWASKLYLVALIFIVTSAFLVIFTIKNSQKGVSTSLENLKMDIEVWLANAT